MRVTGPVAEGVVTPVDGDPADHITLEGHRPRDSERYAQRAACGEHGGLAAGEKPTVTPRPVTR